jgi:hypothetical protein
MENIDRKYSLNVIRDDDGWEKIRLNGDSLTNDDILFLTLAMVAMLDQRDPKDMEVLKEFIMKSPQERSYELKMLFMERNW